MKRILSLIISLLMILSATACNMPASEPVPTDAAVPEQTNTPNESETPPDDEYERAIWYGFVIDELADADPDETDITWGQYCTMLGSMIKQYDETLLSEWEEITENAHRYPQLKRDGAMVSLLFAAKVMGMASFNTNPPAGFGEYAAKVGELATYNYPVLGWDEPVDLGDGCRDENHVGPAYDYCLRRVSAQSGKSLLEFDENKDLRLNQPISLREAVLSVIRLYESENTQRLEPDFVPVADVGVFTLPSELKELALAMPEVDAAALPIWNGIHLKVEDQEVCFNRNFYQEEDVEMIAELGCFNYIGLGYEHWWYTKEEKGELYVDESVMKNIDDFICWCIKRGIHVGFNTCSIPGFLVQAGIGYKDDILQNPDHYRQAVEMCAMLAKRYADVPANAMSFFLIGEPNLGYFTHENYLKLIQDLTSAMREYDTEKVIFTSGTMEISDHHVTTPVDGIGENGTVQAFNAYLRPQLYWNWPNVFVQGKLASWDAAPLTLLGDFAAGAEVAAYVYEVYGENEEVELVIAADGKELSRTVCVTGKHTDLVATAKIPNNAKSITLRAENTQGGEMSLGLACVALKTPSDTDSTYAVPDVTGQTFWHFESGPYSVTNIWCNDWVFGADFAPSTVTVYSDGTYENPDQPLGFTPNTLEEYVLRWVEHTKKEGTSTWCCEWGIPFSLPKETRTEFVRAFLTTLNNHGVSAAMFCGRLGNWGPIIHESAIATGQLALPENWAEEGYSYENGYYYDEATLNVMRELYGN